MKKTYDNINSKHLKQNELDSAATRRCIDGNNLNKNSALYIGYETEMKESDLVCIENHAGFIGKKD